MCGICGIWHRDGQPVEPTRVRAMALRIRHRGPDGEGYWDASAISFGHRRLSILDTTPGADQPMHSADRNLTITFNGEVHNFEELRDTLSTDGFRFRTRTDTEVVLAAWERWGVDALRRFNGMWAFALWDHAKRELTLSRDRLGIKPLYWLRRGRTVAFASEAKALAEAFPKLRVPDREEIAHFLTGGVVAGTEKTFFKDIESVPAGCAIRIGPESERLVRYWSVEDCFAIGQGRQTSHEELLSLLDDAVRLRLTTERPLGTTLSGGLDSSTVAALAARRTSAATLPAFSLSYPGRTIDESGYAEAVTRRFPKIHMQRVQPRQRNLMSHIERIVWFEDAPTPMRGRLPAWLLFRQAGRRVRVLLDGGGGDEILAGYARFLVPAALDLIDGASSRSSPSAHPFSALINAWRRTPPSKLDVLRPFELRAAASLNWNQLRYRRVLRPAFRAGAGSGDLSRQFHSWLRKDTPRPFASRLKNALWHELTRSGLPESLRQTDALTMAHSIECRPPLLDHRIVELCFAGPPDQYFAGGWSKSPLRKATAGLLPESVRRRRRKLGFPSPIAEWLREPAMLNHVRARLAASALVHEAIEPAHLHRLYRGMESFGPPSKRFRDSPEFLWRLLTLAIWERQFLDTRLNPPA